MRGRVKSLPKPFYIFSNDLAFYPGTELHVKARNAGLELSAAARICRYVAKWNCCHPPSISASVLDLVPA